MIKNLQNKTLSKEEIRTLVEQVDENARNEYEDYKKQVLSLSKERIFEEADAIFSHEQILTFISLITTLVEEFEDNKSEEGAQEFYENYLVVLNKLGTNAINTIYNIWLNSEFSGSDWVCRLDGLLYHRDEILEILEDIVSVEFSDDDDDFDEVVATIVGDLVDNGTLEVINRDVDEDDILIVHENNGIIE